MWIGGVVVRLIRGIVRRFENKRIFVCGELIEGDKIIKESYGDERYEIDEKTSDTLHIRILIYKDWRVYQTALAVSGFLDSFECSEGRS